MPEARTPTPSTVVYPAMASPVARAASSAGRCGRFPEPLMPHDATPTSPAEATATPAVAQPSGRSPTNTAARTVTTSGAAPRAIGYIWPKSPSVNERISGSMYATCRHAETSRYGQAPAAGNGAKQTDQQRADQQAAAGDQGEGRRAGP